MQKSNYSIPLKQSEISKQIQKIRNVINFY